MQVKLGYKLFMWHNRPYKILVGRSFRRVVSKPVTKFNDPQLNRIITRLHFTLQAQDYGMRLGIAAPQCGIRKRIMLVEGALFINPEWHPSTQKEESIEGCYSVKNELPYMVPRSKYGWAKWQNAQGEWQEDKFNGRKAIVFQHELDHLNGLLCSDNGTPYSGNVKPTGATGGSSP